MRPTLKLDRRCSFVHVQSTMKFQELAIVYCQEVRNVRLMCRVATVQLLAANEPPLDNWLLAEVTCVIFTYLCLIATTAVPCSLLIFNS